jgi:RimJ/RimL family protein N-acetyltransferase
VTVIRTARPGEIPVEAHVDGDADRGESIRQYLTQLMEQGCTRPEWCFVAESGGRPVASAVLWTLPGGSVPSDLVLVEAPWDDPALAVGVRLLDEVVGFARSAGADELGHVVDRPVQPPQFQHHPDRHEGLVRRAGFTLARDGRRFRWQAGAELPPQDDRLHFRSMAEIGPEPFVDLLAELLPDTADAWLADDVARYGPRQAAQRLFDKSLQLQHEPEWYEIGYDADGSPAVVSLPARSPSFAVIGFVGVAPGHRGRGYSSSVVARGTHILVQHGATEIRGDCDAANVAMVKGFERARYHLFAERRDFIHRPS